MAIICRIVKTPKKIFSFESKSLIFLQFLLDSDLRSLYLKGYLQFGQEIWILGGSEAEQCSLLKLELSSPIKSLCLSWIHLLRHYRWTFIDPLHRQGWKFISLKFFECVSWWHTQQIYSIPYIVFFFFFILLINILIFLFSLPIPQQNSILGSKNFLTRLMLIKKIDEK